MSFGCISSFFFFICMWQWVNANHREGRWRQYLVLALARDDQLRLTECVGNTSHLCTNLWPDQNSGLMSMFSTDIQISKSHFDWHTQVFCLHDNPTNTLTLILNPLGSLFVTKLMYYTAGKEGFSNVTVSLWHHRGWSHRQAATM